MVQHHIAIICSQEQSLDFYRLLGFEECARRDRGYDLIVWMAGNGMTLEIFIDPRHPAHVTGPEAYGLRHFCLATDDLAAVRARMAAYAPEEITVRDGIPTFFVKDPDGLPIEIKEIR